MWRSLRLAWGHVAVISALAPRPSAGAASEGDEPAPLPRGTLPGASSEAAVAPHLQKDLANKHGQDQLDDATPWANRHHILRREELFGSDVGQSVLELGEAVRAGARVASAAHLPALNLDFFLIENGSACEWYFEQPLFSSQVFNAAGCARECRRSIRGCKLFSWSNETGCRMSACGNPREDDTLVINKQEGCCGFAADLAATAAGQCGTLRKVGSQLFSIDSTLAILKCKTPPCANYTFRNGTERMITIADQRDGFFTGDDPRAAADSENRQGTPRGLPTNPCRTTEVILPSDPPSDLVPKETPGDDSMAPPGMPYIPKVKKPIKVQGLLKEPQDEGKTAAEKVLSSIAGPVQAASKLFDFFR